jgi:hypothetical protein
VSIYAVAFLVAAIAGADKAHSAPVWAAGMETGDLSEWGLGSSRDTAPCYREVTTEQARTGMYSLKTLREVRLRVASTGTLKHRLVGPTTIQLGITYRFLAFR